MNFTDVREAVEVKTGGGLIPNNTMNTKNAADYQTGDNVIYNDTARREIHVVINGKNKTKSSIVFNGLRCVYSCLPGKPSIPIETDERLWSNASSWTSGKVPVANESVEIEGGWNMIFDIEESPIINTLEINGRLTFKAKSNLHLRAKHIFVRAGELIIGNETAPFEGNAKITLFGEKANQHIVFEKNVEAGNKVIANTGLIKMYGLPRPITMTRLTKTANPGDKSIHIEPNLDWVAGD